MNANTVVLTADQVLRVFHHDEIYLFLGAAFTTVGIVAGAVSFFGRKFDPLLLWLAIFAILYGNRLWLQTGLLALIVPDSLFFRTLRDSSNYLVPIPGVFFFRSGGYLGRIGEFLVYPFTAIMTSLVVAVFIFGPHPAFAIINSITVVIALLILAFYFLRLGRRGREYRVIRFGLLAFILLALWDNTGGAIFAVDKLEPFGFLIFLAALGYVAAKRNLDRDAQLMAVQKELDVAEQIQRSILPNVFPESADFRVAARYVPMRTVAGDFYDFLPTSDREAGLLIADVSGHGVPAALIASMVKLAAASQKENAADPAAFLAGMNNVLCGNTQSQFVTAAYLHLDARAAEIRYAAAAHPPALLVRDGEVREPIENGLMLGVFDTATYAMAVHPLQPGDRILLYTDGVIEAANIQREEFGRERLSSLLHEGQHLSHNALADLILDRVRAWSDAQDDDLTVLVCDYRPALA
jgi:phosphoserine phosphatase RsbU/P